MEMTKEAIEATVKQNNGYRTPELNDKLYLHCRGFTGISNLEKYTGLKVLWLQGNAISAIANLKSQTELRSLYLHENLISRIENLRHCTNLDTLDLSHNYVTTIENLSCLSASLRNLNLSHNNLESSASLAHLKELVNLISLDLRSNKIDVGDDDDDATGATTTLAILSSCPKLRVLHLQNNPLTKNLPYYRKNVIRACRELRYLDDRPVFPEERRRCEAWCRAMDDSGGDVCEARAVEREVVEALRRERREAEECQWEYWNEVWEEGRACESGRPQDCSLAGATIGETIEEEEKVCEALSFCSNLMEEELGLSLKPPPPPQPDEEKEGTVKIVELTSEVEVKTKTQMGDMD